MKMSLINAAGTCMAMALPMLPLPRSKKNRRGCRSPVPSSTSIEVPDWDREGGQGLLPKKEMRISFLGRVSVPGRYILRFRIAAQGLVFRQADAATAAWTRTVRVFARHGFLFLLISFSPFQPCGSVPFQRYWVIYHQSRFLWTNGSMYKAESNGYPDYLRNSV